MNKNTEEAIRKVQKERMELSRKKHHDYSTLIDNIAFGGLNGIAIRIFDKACRLMSATVNVDAKNEAKFSVLDETLEDTLKDLANYADYGVVLRRDQWEK